MRITHIAGINLAANGWNVVVDQHQSVTANDNWTYTQPGFLADYPRPFRVSLLTQSTSRATITSRVGTLLSTLDAARDYHHWPYEKLRMTLNDGATTYFLPFWPRVIVADYLKWTGTQYVQQVTIEGELLSPPWTETVSSQTFSNLTAFNVRTVALGSIGPYWSPGEIYIYHATTHVGVFGGLWIAESGRYDSVTPLRVEAITTASPPSTPITIGTVTAQQMPTAGTYTYQVLMGISGRWVDAWLHFSSSAPAIIEITSSTRTIAVIQTNPNQLCYYIGFVPPETVLVTVTTSAANAILYPFVYALRNWYRMISYTLAQPIYMLEVLWRNKLISSTMTLGKNINRSSFALTGALECWIPQQGLLLATWSTHDTAITGTVSCNAVAQGYL